MKTSKKILIGFLSVVGMFLLSFMITVERTNLNSNQNKFETLEADLVDIRVIKVHMGVHVNLSSATTNSLEYSFDKKLEASSAYEIVNDTLILKPAIQSDKQLNYKLKLNHIKEIINEGGSINVDLQQDKIDIINKQKGYIQLPGNSNITVADLHSMEGSETIVSSHSLKEFNIRADNATVIVNKPIQRVNLIATNRANVTLQKVSSLISECDSTSQYNVY